jgi:myosin heavy subunit
VTSIAYCDGSPLDTTQYLTQNPQQIQQLIPFTDRVITAAESQLITTCEAQCLDPEIDNLIKLNDLNENSILHNLRIRFKQDKIYTSVSSILISVNPFKMVSADFGVFGSDLFL